MTDAALAAVRRGAADKAATTRRDRLQKRNGGA
jgi:hypothetical protein